MFFLYDLLGYLFLGLPPCLLLAAIVLLILFLTAPKGSKRRKTFGILSAVFGGVGIVMISIVVIFFAILTYNVVNLM